MSTAGGDLPGLAFDAVEAGLVILDAELVVRGWNAWMARTSGVTAGDALGRPLEKVLGRDLPRRVKIAFEHAIGAGASSVLTHALHPAIFPLSSRMGRPILHNVAVTPLGDAGRACLVHVLDVTASTEREQVLRDRQNARYNAVVNSATDAIVTTDGEGMIQWTNLAAGAVFGMRSEDLVGKPIGLVLSDTGRLSDALASIERAVEQGRPVEGFGRRLDGSQIDIEFSASRWQGQGRSYVTAILRDITERRASERQLLQLNETLESLVAERTADRDRMWRLSTDLMLIAHLDGEITATNPAATVLLGWSEARLVGSNIRDLVLAEDIAEWNAAAAALREASAPQRFVLRVRTADQKGRWLEWSAVAADDFIQAVGRDITAEKEAEAVLLATEDALRQSQKMEAIGQLTGGIAHDFNNLLAGVIGGLEIVKRRISTGRYEDVARFMDASISSAQKAAGLTHRLLAFSRQQPLDPKPHDINQLVQDMEDLLRRSLGEQVVLKTQLSRSIGLASTDANQFENAILNLVINARDAMPEGGEVTISTSAVSHDEMQPLMSEGLSEGEYVKVGVTDTGTGMSPEVIAKAFDPFFTTKPIGKGTGLGLSMIYGFAKQTRGHAEIISALGEGTTINLYIPEAEAKSRSAELELIEQAPHGDGETVLVVEDDPSVRMLVAEVLHELGYAAIEVGDSRAALPVLQSDARLDLMISDVGLPGVDGRKLAELAREHRPTLPVLFITGYAQHAKVRGEFLGPGMDMIVKPFALDLLGHKIREILT